MSINLNNEISSFFLERLQMKRDIQSEVLNEYPKDIGTDFTAYGNKINELYGNDVLGYAAADALMGISGQCTVRNSNQGYYYDNLDSYHLRINERNLCAVIDFPEITELSITSFGKFMFWFTGQDVSAINFPNLSVFAVPDDFRYTASLGPNEKRGSLTHYNKKLFPFHSNDKGYCKINMPNLKYVSERLMPRPVCWKYPDTDLYSSQEVDMALSDENDSHVVDSVSCSMWNPSIEKIPDDFVFHLNDGEE